MRCLALLFISIVACSDSSTTDTPATPSPDGSAPSTSAPAATGTCTSGTGVALKVDGKDVRVDVTRKRVFTSGATVIGFGFDDTSTRPLELDEWAFGIKTFVKEGKQATTDWQVDDLNNGTVSLYRVLDQVDVLGNRLTMHYVTPSFFKLTDPGFTLKRVADQASLSYKGEMLLDGLGPDSVPKRIQVDGCFSLPVK